MAKVVRGGGAEKKIMVAIDESENSHYALVWALDYLKESIKNSPLVIFMAQPPTKTPDFVTSDKENKKKLTLAFLEKAKEICSSRGVNAEIATEVGHPRTAICDAVQKFNIKLLILGEHVLGKIERALIGSVSSYCVQNAKCPVLVVKKPLAAN